MDHILVIISSVDAYLGLFHFWLPWVMVQWMLMYKFWCKQKLSFFLGIYLGLELLGHKLPLCLTLWETAKQFPKVSVPSYIPITKEWGLKFLHNLVIVCLFDDRRPGGCEAGSHLVLICISLITNDVEHLFICFWPFVFVFVCVCSRNVYSNFLPSF